MYKKGAGNDKQGNDAGNRTLCPYRNFNQAITLKTKELQRYKRYAIGTPWIRHRYAIGVRQRFPNPHRDFKVFDLNIHVKHILGFSLKVEK